MPDEQPPVTPIRFTQHLVRTVESWPERTSLLPDVVQHPHVYHATYDEMVQMVTFDVFNGTASYHLTGETEAGGALVAERVSHKKTSRRV